MFLYRSTFAVILLLLSIDDGCVRLGTSVKKATDTSTGERTCAPRRVLSVPSVVVASVCVLSVCVLASACWLGWLAR